jgi:general L-amino acid transport system substrate-binding protein
MSFRFKNGLLKPTILLLSLALSVTASDGAFSQTLKAIKDRGNLICGVSQGILGFSSQDANGEWAGLDVDFCRALSAAIFNDKNKVKFVPLSASARFGALQSGEIDVLSRNSTWTMSREVDLGLVFAAVTYYDGQGFMVRRAQNVSSALDLSGSKICVQAGTTTELNLADYFNANAMTYEPVLGTAPQEVTKAYDSGRCDVLTSDSSQLHAERLKLEKPDESIILPDLVSKEPLGPAVRQTDMQWFNISKWTAFALINAEELGVSSKTIDAALKSSKPEIKRLVGTEGDYGERLGLTNDWAARIVRLVGNYGEVYERNIGVKSQLGIPRGINEPWSAGGILYAPPIR